LSCATSFNAGVYKLLIYGIFLCFFNSGRFAKSAIVTGSTQEIAKGVWFHKPEDGHGYCNNIVIEMSDYLIVVDANYPGGAEQMIALVRQLSPKPVKYVFDTHHHGDHSYGNAVWTSQGATTLAYQGVVDEMNQYEPARWLASAKTRGDVADLHLSDAQRPTKTFNKSPFVLKDGTREVRFYFFGWGHTRGDGYVWLPKEHVLCTGDAAVNGPYNKIVDANIRNWPHVLDHAIALKPVHVLPGHGAAGGPEILDGQRRFLVDLYSAVDDAHRRGQKPDQMNIQLPAPDRNWVPTWLIRDVVATYEEISSGKPHGALPHAW
jgi:cyclase